jgi:hypothetical protein
MAIIAEITEDTVEELLSALRRARAQAAVSRLRRAAAEQGLQRMTEAEIEAEIAQTRRERRKELLQE